MDDGCGQEEYIHQILEAYRKTPGTVETVAVQTECWPPNSTNAAFP